MADWLNLEGKYLAHYRIDQIDCVWRDGADVKFHTISGLYQTLSYKDEEAAREAVKEVMGVVLRRADKKSRHSIWTRKVRALR